MEQLLRLLAEHPVLLLTLLLAFGSLLGTDRVKRCGARSGPAAPARGFALGEAAGTLLVGLVFGRLVRIGPVVVSMGHAAASSLSTFGMIPSSRTPAAGWASGSSPR